MNHTKQVDVNLWGCPAPDHYGASIAEYQVFFDNLRKRVPEEHWDKIQIAVEEADYVGGVVTKVYYMVPMTEQEIAAEDEKRREMKLRQFEYLKKDLGL
jgi:hypothetical protein